MMQSLRLLLGGLIACSLSGPLSAASLQPSDYKETPSLLEDVKAGRLPPIAQRLPENPQVVTFEGGYKTQGVQGGELRWLIGRAKDVRFMTVYGYARLVGYDEKFMLQPDILASIDIEDERVFTMKLRKGHKWSDGAPFSSEDFRYWWEDVANNAELNPGGISKDLMVDGEKPKVEIVDEITVRFSWSKPNPFFLPRLAGPSPLYIYRPAHYLKKFHSKYGDAAELKKLAEARKQRSWAGVHNALDNMYDADNPDLPTLEPWMIVTKPPSTRFIAQRNPYYHRIDAAGQQLPYVDQLVMNQAAPALVPVKASAGETDIQARGLSFANFTFLKDNEISSGAYKTLLWRTAKGAHFALFPNLNTSDPVWRELIRDVRFRRALSLGINREEVNDALFLGIAIEGNNTVLPGSPLFKEEYQKKWATYDPVQANRLLDQIGLKNRNADGFRLLSDGRVAEIVVETAGEDTEQTDVLELIRETWKRIGIKLFSKPSQREILRNRVFSGQALMSVWTGFENGLPTPAMSPAELAPTSQISLQWPKWGQYNETQGKSGEPVDLPEATELLQLNEAWLKADPKERERIWHRMLQIHMEQQYIIGVVAGVQQPIVINKRLRNVPKDGVYNWEPGSHFGVYRPDTFWLEEKPARGRKQAQAN